MAMKTAMKILATIFSIFNLDKEFTLPWIIDSQTGILGTIVSFPALQSPLLLPYLKLPAAWINPEQRCTIFHYEQTKFNWALKTLFFISFHICFT
jgi:hypothetical protein